MATIQITMLPASTYEVPHGEQTITMVSVAYGSAVLACDTLAVRNVDDAIRAVRATYDRVLVDHQDRTFVTMTRCIGRKLARFDDFKAALNPTHVAAVPA